MEWGPRGRHWFLQAVTKRAHELDRQAAFLRDFEERADTMDREEWYATVDFLADPEWREKFDAMADLPRPAVLVVDGHDLPVVKDV